ncbi:hypothetical protein LSAT2_003786 [Lamellibrachia satsuma]|nr:hypothetical protein LSAT2_003786 [Lamellibrachia satsuma]
MRTNFGNYGMEKLLQRSPERVPSATKYCNFTLRRTLKAEQLPRFKHEQCEGTEESKSSPKRHSPSHH